MKWYIEKVYLWGSKSFFSLIATLALVITTISVNSACWYVMGQDELPINAERLRKFD